MSSATPEQLALAGLFPPVDRQQWQEAVATALRKSGRIGPEEAAETVEQVLTSLTYDGIAVRPLYTAADLPTLAGLLATAEPSPQVEPLHSAEPIAMAVSPTEPTEPTEPNGWDLRQRQDEPDPEAAREAVLADLENGVTSLWLTVGRGPEAVPGLPLGSLAMVLREVHLNLAPVVLDAGPDTEAAAEEFFDLISARPAELRPVSGNLGADPIGLRARTGTPGNDDSESRTGTSGSPGGSADPAGLELLGRLALRCRQQAPGVRACTVDATVHHDAGGSDADELGAAIATGVSYLRALSAAGLDLDQAFGQIDFRLAASADQFLTIAKFRAARQLWARVAQVCGVNHRARLHAVTSSAMITRRDPWVNLLRTTLACFGAGVGGADAITVQPFDAAIGRSDGFSRRIARNTSSLLTLESHLARVDDPAGGSWYVERLTDDLANAAWEWFTEIESAGGMLAALDSGLVARRLETTWARRADNLAHRRDPLTGVSEFPNLDEAPVLRSVRVPTSPPGPGALPRRRYAAEFEALRDAADAHAERTGRRPAVFLATIGPVAKHTARASFAANLFQAGGLDTPTSGPGSDPASIAAAFIASGAQVACLAASDLLYGEHAVAVAAALTAAGAGPLWLAGKPGKDRDRYAEAGIEHFVFAGVNALATLSELHRMLSVTCPDPGGVEYS